MTIALWVVQVLLSLLFLFMGGQKVLQPGQDFMARMAMPTPFIQFIGVCEVLGALGLILPAALRIKPWLTPLAAAGLLMIMLGAVVTTSLGMGPSAAVMPTITGLLLAFVAYGRWRLAPLPAAGVAAHRTD